MRGVTPSERVYLQRRADNTPREYLPPDDPRTAVGQQLSAHGRVRFRPGPLESAPGGRSNLAHLTELGRLALRVCPIDEF